MLKSKMKTKIAIILLFILLFCGCWFFYIKITSDTSENAEITLLKIQEIQKSDHESRIKVKEIRNVLKQTDIVWYLVGFVGEALFGSRMLVQWVASERAKKNVFPALFWYLSLIGSFLVLLYALHINDPVFIFSKGAGFFIYIRNIVLLFKEKKSENI